VVRLKNKENNQSIISKDGVSYLIPFILVTSCFALWGFANDITNPMVKAFSKIFRMSVTDGALVQVSIFLSYINDARTVLDIRSSLLTFGKIQTSLVLLSLNRSLVGVQVVVTDNHGAGVTPLLTST